MLTRFDVLLIQCQIFMIHECNHFSKRPLYWFSFSMRSIWVNCHTRFVNLAMYHSISGQQNDLQFVFFSRDLQSLFGFLDLNQICYVICKSPDWKLLCIPEIALKSLWYQVCRRWWHWRLSLLLWWWFCYQLDDNFPSNLTCDYIFISEMGQRPGKEPIGHFLKSFYLPMSSITTTITS